MSHVILSSKVKEYATWKILCQQQFTPKTTGSIVRRGIHPTHFPTLKLPSRVYSWPALGMVCVSCRVRLGRSTLFMG